MRRVLLSLLLTCSCGTQSSGPGAPTNAPASGIGASVPLDDSTGLTWTAPFILADPAHACDHPTVLADGDALDMWVGVTQGDARYIAHAHAATFAMGFGDLDDTLRPVAAWEMNALSSPSIVRTDEEKFLFYVAGGQIGLARIDGAGTITRRSTPLYTDTAAISSIGAALRSDRVRIVVLAGERIDELEVDLPTLRGAVQDGAVTLTPHATQVEVPSWAVGFIDVGLRIDRTAAGRLREDLLFAALLPNALDLGTQPLPSAIGAASRYLSDDVTATDPAFEMVPAAIMSGPPQPHGPVTVAYRGGVLLVYSARSGPRDAIGVAVHP